MEYVKMIELGKTQCLNVVKITDFGVYLGTEEEKVLLPKKEVPEDTEVGDAFTVFVYRDSSDRLIATTRKPKIELGKTAVLKVSQTGKIGAFLDWGLEKDLLLPFKEQTTHIQEGNECLVALYIDKSNRLAATMRVYDYLSCDSHYVKDSAVTGRVIEVNPDYGVYIAIDDKYFGMVPKYEAFGDFKKERLNEWRRIVFDEIKKNGGSIPFTDKASPDVIKAYFKMSKNAFKRAVGRLLKEGKIEIKETSIVEKKY